MFKFTNKDTRATCVSIANFEQVNADWSVTPLNQIHQLYEVLENSRAIDYGRKLIASHSQWPDAKQDSLITELKQLTTKLSHSTLIYDK